MKVKYKLIPFAVFTIAMGVLKIMGIYCLDDDGLLLGMNWMQLTYVVIVLSIALFVVCMIMNIFDKKTAPVYQVAKNPVAGVFSIISGLSVAAASIMTFVNTAADSEYYLMLLICALFSIPAAIALILMSRVHFSGKTTVSGMSALYIFPAMWGCAELVSEFLVATKTSISSADMTSLFCYIFLTLYFFSHAMIVSRIKGRNPVKACFIYGLPAVAVSLVYGIYVICTATRETSSIDQTLLGVQFTALALYALSFIFEMAFNALTKDEVEIIDGIQEDEDTYENSYIKSGGYDALVYAEKPETPADEAPDEPQEIPLVTDMDDYVLGYDDSEPEAAADTAADESNKAHTGAGHLAEKKRTAPKHTAVKNENNSEPASAKKQKEEQLSEIDRILKELDSKR